MEIYMMVYTPGVSLTDGGSQGCAESQIVNILSNHNKWPSLEQQPWWRHIKTPFYERSAVTIVTIVSMTSHQHLTQADLYTSHQPSLCFVRAEANKIRVRARIVWSLAGCRAPAFTPPVALLLSTIFICPASWKDVHITILTETWFYPHLIV